MTATNGKLGSSIINVLINEIGKENVVGIVKTPEKDVRESGFNWNIGRNGLYSEPNLEYIDT